MKAVGAITSCKNLYTVAIQLFNFSSPPFNFKFKCILSSSYLWRVFERNYVVLILDDDDDDLGLLHGDHSANDDSDEEEMVQTTKVFNKFLFDGALF